MEYSRDYHWREVTEYGDNKKNIRSLRCDVSIKVNGGLIKREFLVSVPNPKGGKYHIIK